MGLWRKGVLQGRIVFSSAAIADGGRIKVELCSVLSRQGRIVVGFVHLENW
jgi:hypothetical protein